MNVRWMMGLCLSSLFMMSCSDDDESAANQHDTEIGGAHSGGKNNSSASGGRNASGGTMVASQGGSDAEGGVSSGGSTSEGGSISFGGSTALGGTSSIGGAVIIAGNSSTGGVGHLGGNNSSGGATSIAGQATSGGSSTASGGNTTGGITSVSGGKTSSAGTSSIGGSASGGYSTAGTMSVGGTTHSAGGTTSIGGSSVSTGGTTSTGGSSQAGSVSVSGGSSSGGSVSSGGASTEGGTSSSGGVAGGGNASGGISSIGGASSTGGLTSTGGTTSTIPGIISFVTLPDTIKTNLNTFLVSGIRPLGASVSVNGAALSATGFGPGRGFAATTVLAEGENTVTLEIVYGTETSRSQRRVVYDPTYSTADLRLVYVDVVTGTDLYPAISGTIVLSPDENSILGIIPDRHIVGVAPNGAEIYFSDLSVFSREYHGYLRTLAFTQSIPSNGFIVSPDGTVLFSRSERLNVVTNLLGVALPLDITTGNSWSGAPVPGGPVMTSDGKKIYCCSPLNIVDTELNTKSSMGSITTTYLSDLALSLDDQTLFLSRYTNAAGYLYAYNTQTNSQVSYIYGSGDFAGEIGVLPDGNIVQGASGNPLYLGGGLSLLGWPATTIISLNRVSFPLADNLTVSKGTGEIFVSSSDSTASVSTGISVYVNASQQLKLLKQFNLGVNGYKSASGVPWNNQIRKIVIAE